MRRAALGAVLLCWAGTVGAAPVGTITLGDAYRMALAASEQVQIAAANLALADASYTDQLAIMGPTIALNGAARYQNRAEGVIAPGQLPIGQQAPYAVAVQATITQPLFRRSIFDARRAAKFGVESSAASVKRARQQLMFDVTNAFIGVMRARQQFIIGQGAVKRAELQLQSAVARVKVGGALKTAELLAQIDLNRAQTQINTADGQVRAAESTLQRLIGAPPPQNLVLPKTPEIASVADALESSHSERADLHALHLATAQARATVTMLQNRIFWPTVDLNLFGGYVINGNVSSPPADYRFPIYGLVGNFTVPLFQTGDEWMQVRMQRQRVGLAIAQESFFLRQIEDDVRSSIARFEVARKGIDIANEQQKAAQQNYQLVSTHYKLGVASLLELVTAQAAVFEAETNLVLAQYERELATYQLLFAEGKIDL